MSDREPFVPLPDSPLPAAAAGHAPRRVLGGLWTYQKEAECVVAVIVEAPCAEELRLVRNHQLYLTELCPNREALLARAEVLGRRLEAHGWIRL